MLSLFQGLLPGVHLTPTAAPNVATAAPHVATLPAQYHPTPAQLHPLANKFALMGANLGFGAVPQQAAPEPGQPLSFGQRLQMVAQNSRPQPAQHDTPPMSPFQQLLYLLQRNHPNV